MVTALEKAKTTRVWAQNGQNPHPGSYFRSLSFLVTA